MRILVTGAHGKVGRALVPRLVEAGHDVRASDLTRPVWDRVAPGEPEDYWQADLTDAGAAYALVAGCDVVVHTAAIPQPIHNAPHVVFGNNMMSTFNLLEAAIAGGARRFVTSRARPCRGSSTRSGRSRPSTCRSTRSTRSDRRTPTRPRSGSASSSASARSSGRRSAARRSARPGCRTRRATSATSAPSCAIPPC